MLSHVQTSAQELTRIRGTIIDEVTEEPLPFVNISFAGTTVGTVSNVDGTFYLETAHATTNLKSSYIGYDQKITKITIGISQTIQIRLAESSLQLNEVVVEGEKLRYRNKDNPAVDLIKLVLAHKKENQPENHDYFEYDKYEKIEFDFNNITEKFMNKGYMKDFQMVFDYMDTSEVNGKAYLPVFLRESSSRVYYRKNPEKTIEHKQGEKMTGFADYMDDQGISSLIDKMYQDINIYDNNVKVLTQEFTSPISPLGPITYKYYIADTLVIDGEKLFKLSFQPRNEAGFAFVGNLFITADSAYAVKKAAFTISQNANINFVEDLFIDQEFEKTSNGTYVIKTDKISIDFSLLSENGIGMYGKRSVSYRDRKFGVQHEDEWYSKVGYAVDDIDLTEKSDEFWEDARHSELTRSEQGVFEMVEEVEELPAFQRMVKVLTFIMVGYLDFGAVEIGPVNSFVSWNDIEGFRMKFGGHTTSQLNENWEVGAYIAYGFNDAEFKHSATLTRYFNQFPMHAIRLTNEKEIKNPGADIAFLRDDNFLLSVRRGVNDKRMYTYKTNLEYIQEVTNGLSYVIGAKTSQLEPGGVLSFLPGETSRSDYISKEERKTQSIRTSEVNLTLRFAPNEQIYQGKKGRKSRVTIPNKYPIFTLKYDRGFDNVFNSDYSYDRVSLNISKRTYVAPIGYFDLEVEGRKLFGQVPYPLLNIPRANQTYSYQVRSYNLMNYLEFVSDQYVSVNFSHYFNGFILNKVPVIKKLKWRSLVTFKGIVGDLSDKNNPSFNPGLPGLPNNADGSPATYPMSHYIETSFGVMNVFTFFRFDLVKRWTQQDREDALSGYYLRARFKVEF